MVSFTQKWQLYHQRRIHMDHQYYQAVYLSSFFFNAIIAYVWSFESTWWHLLGWLVTVTSLLGVRFYLSHSMISSLQKKRYRECLQGERLVFVTNVAYFVLWGLGLFSFFPERDTQSQMITLILSAGYLAGGVVSYGHSLPLMKTFISTTLAPLLITSLMIKSHHPYLMLFAISIYGAFLYNMARTIYSNQRQSLDHYIDQVTLNYSLKKLNHTLQEKNEELLSAQEQMTHASQLSAVGEVSASIAHEVNNPLMIISGHAFQIVQETAKKAPNMENVTNYANKIIVTTQRIVKIITALKLYSHKNPSQVFISTSFDEIINQVLDLTTEQLRLKNVELRLPPMADLFLVCQPVQLSQVFLNLMNNAIHAIENLPERWIELKIDQNGEGTLIQFIDSGLGIDKELREKIMMPFFTTRSQGQGTGLGLSLSKGIVEAHEGEMWVDPHHPHTCFKIFIPRLEHKMQSLAA